MQTIQMSEELKWLLGGVLVLYVAVVYVLAVFAHQRIHSTEDFAVAGRRLPLSFTWMTLLATWFGRGPRWRRPSKSGRKACGRPCPKKVAIIR